MAYRPGEVAKNLNISPVTLRVWSNEFSVFLSEGAQRSINTDGKAAQRRYSDTDIAILHQAKQLLDSGMTFDEARRAMLDAEKASPETMPALVEAARFLAEIRAAYDQIVEAKDTAIEEQRQHIKTLQELVERQQAEIDRLRAASQVSQSWWQRLFRR